MFDRKSTSLPDERPPGIAEGEVVDSRRAYIGLNTGISEVWNVMPLAGSEDNSFELRLFGVETITDENRQPSYADDAVADLEASIADMGTGLAMALKDVLTKQIGTPEEPKPANVKWARELLAWIGDAIPEEKS